MASQSALGHKCTLASSLQLTTTAASSSRFRLAQRAVGSFSTGNNATRGIIMISAVPRRSRGTISRALGGSSASSTAAPSIEHSSSEDGSLAASLPDAFALLGLNRAAARASVISAYEDAAEVDAAAEGFSKAAVAARAVVLKAAADVLLDPQSRLAHERGMLPLSPSLVEGGGSGGNDEGALVAVVVGALMLSREAASRAPNAATGARASSEVASRGEAMLSSIASGKLGRGGGSGGVFFFAGSSTSNGKGVARDVSLATALAHCDAAAAAVAADSGRRSGAAAAARLARAVELLDEHHGPSSSSAVSALRDGAAKALSELNVKSGGGGADVIAPAAAPISSSSSPASELSESSTDLLSSAADVLASSFSAADRRVALDSLVRAVSLFPSISSPSSSAPSQAEMRALLQATWPHLTASEQIELLDAAEVGGAGANDAKRLLPAAAAAGALIASAVARSSTSLVGRAARLLDEEAAASATPPSSAARAARVSAALMLGDVSAAEAAVGVSPERQILGNQKSSPPAKNPWCVPDPRLASYVSSFDARDPLPGLCALAEAWVNEAALGGCRGGPSTSSSPSAAAAADFSLARWASSPAVALRLAAGEKATAARAVVGGATEVFSKAAGALARSVGGVVSLLKNKTSDDGGEEGEPFDDAEEEEIDAEAEAAYRARFYGDEEGEEVVDEEAPPASSPRSSSSSSTCLAPPVELPLEAAKAKTVGELAQAYARATDTAAWRSTPLPPDAVRPLEGENDLWLGTRAARSAASPLQSLLLLVGRRGDGDEDEDESSSSLLKTALGLLLVVGVAVAGSSLASGRVSAPALPFRRGAGVAAAASAAPLTTKQAKRLLSSFQTAKASACGSSSLSSEEASSKLELALSGKLLSEWKARRRDLDGWTLSYKTRKIDVVSSPAISSKGLFSSSSPSSVDRATFVARVEEKVTLRDDQGQAVDESEARYDARFTAERQGNGDGGEWKLCECVVL